MYMIKYKNIEWINKQGALIPRNVPHKILSLTKEEEKELLKISGAYFLRWNSTFDTSESDFWYIIKDTISGLEELSKNTRSKIRRGLKHCYAKPIDYKIFLDQIYEVYFITSERYETFEDIMDKNKYIDYINGLDDEKYQFYGVFDKKTNILIGYAQNYIDDDVCFYEELFYHPEYLRNYNSYVLIYNMNEYYLLEKEMSYVHDGSRNLSHFTAVHDFLMDKFKFRKAYCNMEIAYRKDIELVVKLLYPLKSFIDKLDSNVFQKISVLLKHEEIRRSSVSL